MTTLYPQNNAARMMLDLGGIWDFRFMYGGGPDFCCRLE